MEIKIEVSMGEAIDKFSILEIKLEQIKDSLRLSEVKKERDILYGYIGNFIEKEEYRYHYECLHKINKEIWILSELVRDKSISEEERNGMFLETFYKNDARFRVKSKLNRLTRSSINEQKSYMASTAIIKSHNDLSIYREKNSYIRYLALCYDQLTIEVIPKFFNIVKAIFKDDPSIQVIEKTSTDAPGVTIILDEFFEPIKNLYKKYDFSYYPSIKYVSGGKLGDTIHLLYTIMCTHTTTGCKGKLYLTDDYRWGGDAFSRPVVQTYEELKEIVTSQDYIDTFELYKEGVSIDINLNSFRRYQRLYYDTWLEILSETFGHPLIEKPWLSLPVSWKTDKYKGSTLICRSLTRHTNKYTSVIHDFMEKNPGRYVFVSCDKSEYEKFPLKDKVTFEEIPTLKDLLIAIDSCDFYIGNQTSSTVLSYGINKEMLCESCQGNFYTRKNHYKNFYWFTDYNSNMNMNKEIRNT